MAAERAIVFAGGGTGGHVFPGLAVARELRRRDPARPLEWIGAIGGLEERLVPQDGFPLLALRLSGMARLGAAARIAAAARATIATLRLGARFARRRPLLLVGVGGFASGPALLAGRLLGTPTMILEQNAVAGATNRWLSRFADAAAAAFAESAGDLKCRVVVTGNPVRDDVAAIPPRAEGPARLVLGFGGSRGARALDEAWIGALPLLKDSGLRFALQTGADDQEKVAAAARAAGVEADVRPFFDDMPARLAAADLVVARAGATTVAELAAAGRPSLLVPFPFAANDHQKANAEAFAARGAAVALDQRELTPERLAAEVGALARDPSRLAAMAAAARAAAHPDAAARAADLAEELARGRKRP